MESTCEKIGFFLFLSTHIERNRETAKMADTTVEFVLNKLTEQLRDDADLIAPIEDVLACLLSELHHLRAFLIEANRNRRGGEILKHFVKELNRQVNKAENSIDKFMIEAKLNKKKRSIFKIFDLRYVVKGKRYEAEIRSILEKLKEIRKDAAYGLSMSLQHDDSKQTAHQLTRVTIFHFQVISAFEFEFSSFQFIENNINMLACTLFSKTSLFK